LTGICLDFISIMKPAICGNMFVGFVSIVTLQIIIIIIIIIIISFR